jgi:hypothetical protein
MIKEIVCRMTASSSRVMPGNNAVQAALFGLSFIKGHGLWWIARNLIRDLKSPGRERYGKGAARRQVGDGKANTRELPIKCRKLSDDVKTSGFRYGGISLADTCLRARWRPA